MVLAFIVAIKPVNAGFWSFISSGLKTEALASPITGRMLNSQTMSLLSPALNLDPNPAKGGGDTLIVGNALLADAGPLGTIADIEDVPVSDQISLYVVREGDALTQIAQMFGVSVNTILWANDLPRGTKIKEGQTLVILPVSGVRHTVVKGNTVKSIAKQYGADVSEIASFNGIDENHPLAVGQIVIVPDGEIAPVPVRAGKSVIAGGGRTVGGFFSAPLTRYRKTQGLHGYNGVDLAAPAGTPILAAASGVVIVSKSGAWNGGYGNYVVIKHENGTQTLYAHNQSNTIAQGQRVERGQIVGYVGSTGRSTGTHLHFEVRGAKNPF